MIVRDKFVRRSFFFNRDEAGVAAIEFAIMLPILLFLFIGMIELVTALSYDRRVSKTGSSIADLVARSDDVTGDMNDIETAIAHQMTPFENSDVDVRLGMVLIHGGNPLVVWSWGNRTPVPWPQGSQPTGVSFSPSMLIDGQYYLVSSTRLDYPFILGNVLSSFDTLITKDASKFTSISLSDSFVLQPRRVSCVEFQGNCASYSP